MQLILEYDRSGDILEASLDDRTLTIARDLGDDVWVKVDAETGAWRGFIVLKLTKHQHPVRLESPRQAPLAQSIAAGIDSSSKRDKICSISALGADGAGRKINCSCDGSRTRKKSLNSALTAAGYIHRRSHA
jgi:hypothetical protein